MAAPYSDLPDKLEDAFIAVIQAAVTGIPNDQVHSSFADNYEAKLLGSGAVIVTCQGGDQDSLTSGNFKLRISVEVHSVADREEATDTSPRATHRTRCAKVFDALQNDALDTELNTAGHADFYVFGPIIRGIGPNRVQDRIFISERFYDLVCCPSDVS